MSDHLDGLFERLRDAPPPEPFAPAAAVRRRGRQRSLRQAASVGVAVLAVIGLGAASLVTIGQPDPPIPPATAPAATAIPDSWLLTAADLGPGDWLAKGWEPEALAGDPPWFWADLCGASLGQEYPSLASRLDFHMIAWTDGPWYGEADPTNWVYQVVELFDADAAVTNLNDVRSVVSHCGEPVRLTYGVEVPKSEIVDTDFTGDESLLVVERAYPDLYTYTAVVRVGAAVTTLRSFDVELARSDDEYLRLIAARAATRLR